jgi:hypothetical protein
MFSFFFTCDFYLPPICFLQSFIQTSIIDPSQYPASGHPSQHGIFITLSLGFGAQANDPGPICDDLLYWNYADCFFAEIS